MRRQRGQARPLVRPSALVRSLAPKGLALLFGLLLAVNLIGDALRDVLDPRTRGEHG